MLYGGNGKIHQVNKYRIMSFINDYSKTYQKVLHIYKSPQNKKETLEERKKNLRRSFRLHVKRK